MNNSDFQACYKCLKRHVGCHSKCHDYLKEAANHQIEKEKTSQRKRNGEYLWQKTSVVLTNIERRKQ